MTKVFILYHNFYTKDGKEITIGGIQTYIKMLCEVVKKNDMIPVIMQYSSVSFIKKYNDIEVIGVPVKEKWSNRKKNTMLFRACKKLYNNEKDIIIFGTHTMAINNNAKRTIGIQHGINFDTRVHENYSHIKNIIFGIIRTIMSYRSVLYINKFNKIVAVDYNFVNWYRTKVAYTEKPISVIPNCTDYINEEIIQKDNDKIQIIFARRFFKHRGTRLFGKVIKNIINKYENVYVTFAGSGPDEMYLKELFKNEQKVNFIKYDSENSLDIHKNFHIAVVPTIGSEGTSLSLLEAMATKCSVIASNVGGLTNIILDNYNGLMINPEEEELYEALEMLIINKQKREILANNAYNTVLQSFSREIWEKKWTKVLLDIKRKY